MIPFCHDERAEIIKNKSVYAPKYLGQADEQISANTNELESGKARLIASTLQTIKGNFTIPNKIVNNDFDVIVTTTSKLFSESGFKRITDPKQLVKLMPILEASVNGAIALEAHGNRYFYDDYTTMFLNLIGGYVDGENFVPIRFGVRCSADDVNYLYVVIDDEPIKKAEVIIRPSTKTMDRTRTNSALISVSKLLQKVNNPDILKYIPDTFLDEGRKKAKYEAVAETIKYTNDKNDSKYKNGF